jgi:3-isopropylmalate dehydrogenase
MLLRYSLGLVEEARAIEQAIGEALASGVRTADLAQEGETKVGTRAMAAEIEARIALRSGSGRP